MLEFNSNYKFKHNCQVCYLPHNTAALRDFLEKLLSQKSRKKKPMICLFNATKNLRPIGMQRKKKRVLSEEDIYADCPVIEGFEYDKDYYLASSNYSTFIDNKIAKLTLAAQAKSAD